MAAFALLSLPGLAVQPSAAQPSVQGQWATQVSWPFAASHAALLADGRVLVWNDVVGVAPRIWNPSNGSFVTTTIGTTLVGSASAILPDGDIAILGGRNSIGAGLRDVHAFDVATGAWTSLPLLAQGRDEATAVLTGDGRLLALSGEIVQGQSNSLPEIAPPGSPWNSLDNAALGLPATPWTFQLADSTFLVTGPDRNTRRLDPQGDGDWTFIAALRAGSREAGTAVLVPGFTNRILAIGGRNPATASCEILDLATANAWELTGTMARARRHHNATLLADGTVLVTGGTVVDDALEHAVLTAERWTPQTTTWTTLASMTTSRRRASIALLLPDARVLVAGGGDGTPGSEVHADAQIFSPPYLFVGTRPTVSAAPTSIEFGSTFNVDTPQASDVMRVWLVRGGSVTRGFNADQRALQLSYTTAGTRLTVTPPSGPNVAPPGTWILFLVSSAGAPSIGRVVRLSVPVPPTVPPQITSTPPPSTVVNTPFAYVPTATGTTPMTWSLTAGPPWLAVSPSTGALGGVPTTTGNVSVSLRATNAGGNNTQTWTLQVTSSQTGVRLAVPLGDTWRYFKGTSNPAANWATIGFNDATWSSGASGFGFGDNDDATVLADMQGNYTTVFTRRSFTTYNVHTVSKVSILHEYDDGLVVYLNGTRILARNAPAAITNTSVATSSHEAGTTLLRQDFTDATTRALLVNGTNVVAAVGLNQTLSSTDATLKVVLELTGGTVSPVDTGDPTTVAAVAWLGARPNPFHDRARLAFRIATTGPVSLDIFDPAGRLVRRILPGTLAAGEHAILWDGRSADGDLVSPGVYFYTLRAPGIERSGKLTRAR